MSNNNLQRGQNSKRQQRQAQQYFHERLMQTQKSRGTRRGRGNSAAVRSATGGLPGGPAA